MIQQKGVKMLNIAALNQVAEPIVPIRTLNNQAHWPVFFIVGAAKAGTTLLWSRLRKHPDLFLPEKKEFHYFSQVQPDPHERFVIQAVTNETAYLRHFLVNRPPVLAGEASTSYLWHPQTAQRIRERVPEARILILLRNPLDRLISHYRMDVALGLQPLGFREAILEDQGRSKKGWGISHLYLELGYYAEQIERYLARFPEHQILILYAPDLKLQQNECLARVCGFLGVDPSRLPSHSDTGTQDNAYAVGRTAWMRWLWRQHGLRYMGQKIIPSSVRYAMKRRWMGRPLDPPAIDPGTQAWLSEHYEPYQTKLENLLGPEARCLRQSHIQPG